jgi:hypothetical protein
LAWEPVLAREPGHQTDHPQARQEPELVQVREPGLVHQTDRQRAESPVSALEPELVLARELVHQTDRQRAELPVSALEPAREPGCQTDRPQAESPVSASEPVRPA